MSVKGPFEYPKSYIGLSTDTKPAVSVGDKFFEYDTKLWFIYNGSTWSEYISGSGGGGTSVPENYTTITDPATNAAVSTAILDAYGGVIITTTTTGNAQTIQSPTITTVGKTFIVANNDSSTHSITVNSVTLAAGDSQWFVWDGTAWSAVSSMYATTSSSGVIELSTNAESVTGSDIIRAITPSTLSARLAAPGTIGGTTPGVINGTTINGTTFDTNVTAAGVTLSGTTLAADGSDANINITLTPKGTGVVNVSTGLNIASTISIVGVIDDDTMATASATTIPTSESVKSYVDAFISPDIVYYAVTDPAKNAAVTTDIIDDYAGVVITTTTTGKAQTLQTPTDTVTGKTFTVVNNDTSTNSIAVNGITLAAGDAQMFFWDSSAWIAIENVYATTSSDGVVRLSTAALAVTGTNTTRVITPSTLTSRLASPGTIGGTTPGAATFTTVGATTGNITTVNATTVNGTTFDTNVAAAGVTLSGTTLSADGTDADININITAKGTGKVIIDDLQLTADLAVSEGGTGASTLTDNGVLYGNGTAAVAATAEGATGTVLAGTTGNPPSFTATPSVTSVTATTGYITTLDTNVAAAGVTLAGTTLAADGTDGNIDINITPKGTGKLVVNGVISGYNVITEVDCSSGVSLSAAQVCGTILTNAGQGAADVQNTLPAAAAGYSFVAIMGTTQAANTWKLTAGAGDKIYLDGTAGTDAQSVIITPTVGDYITVVSFKSSGSTYDWIARTGVGTWTAGA